MGIDIRKGQVGWVVDITNEVHGMLEQGGWCGRKVLVRYESLIPILQAKSTDWTFRWPSRQEILDYIRASDWCGDRVLRKGCVIR